MSSALIDQLDRNLIDFQCRRDTRKTALDALLRTAERGKRNLNETEARNFDSGISEIKALDEEIKKTEVHLMELQEAADREARTAAVRKEYGMTGLQSAYVTDPDVYHKGPGSPSFFRDLWHAQLGDMDAGERLRRNNAIGRESRALGNTGAVGGSGGEFAPPLWAVEDYIRLARAGRVTVDLFHHEDLPKGVSSINIPKIGTGTTVAIQSTQNTALSQTDITTTSLSSGIVVVGGKQVVSQELLDQSAIPFDQIIIEDLAAAYAQQIGPMVLTGTGTGGQLRGYLTPASTSVTTWTSTTPTATTFYQAIAACQAKVYAGRHAAPDTVVMHPTRWAWLASYLDANGRPLVVPESDGPFNSIAGVDAYRNEGRVGQLLGMDVYVDPAIPENLGLGTNQDVCLVFKRDDIWMWESTPMAETFREPFSDAMGILYRIYAYSSLIPDRYLASLGQIVGTGMVVATPGGFT